MLPPRPRVLLLAIAPLVLSVDPDARWRALANVLVLDHLGVRKRPVVYNSAVDVDGAVKVIIAIFVRVGRLPLALDFAAGCAHVDM